MHNGHHLVLQPRTAQSSGIGIERSVQLGRHLGKRQPETQRGIGRHAGVINPKGKISGIMIPEIDDHLFTALERAMV